MKYCIDTTLNHPLCCDCQKEIESLNTIFLEEGCKTSFFNKDDKALNLDKVERKRCSGKRSPNPTMDITIGISREKKNSGLVRKMLLIELKFDVIKPTNLEKKKLKNKIDYSISLLGQEIPVNEEKIFLFGDKEIQQAKRYVGQLFTRSSYKVKIMTAKEFKEKYF